MFLGELWEVDDFLTFACNTHDSTADNAATDATGSPAYRVYEDETGTAILTGSMAKLDDANTVGFYSERIQLTAANGFEVGKCYTIYVSATVSAIVGTTSHSFRMSNQPEMNIVDNGITAAKYDESTAFPIKSADTGATQVARVGADGDTLETLSDQIDGTATAANLTTVDTVVDAIKAVTDVIPDSGAMTSIATAANLTTVDTVVDAIKLITDALPDSGALTSLAQGTDITDIKGATFLSATDSLEAIRDRGDAAWTTGAGGGGDATEAKQDTIIANLATVDTVADGIKAVTDVLPDSGALTSVAQGSDLATVDTVVDAIKVVTDALPDSGALTSLAQGSDLTIVDTVVDGIKAVTDNLPNSGALTNLDAAISSRSDFDETTDNVKLAADGLDIITNTEPSAYPTNFRERLVTATMAAINKSTLDASEQETFKANGTSAFTQSVSNLAGVQTRNKIGT